MSRTGAILTLAAAGALGGAFWALKGAMIVLTGAQPRYLFEVAPVGFALTLAGFQLLGLRRDAVGRWSAFATFAALVLSVAAAVAAIVAEEQLSSEQRFSPLSLLPLGSMIATTAALVLVGVATRRKELLPPGWRAFPFWMGIAQVPAVMVGGALLEAVHERLFEVPVVLVGLAWIVLGSLLGLSARLRNPVADTQREGTTGLRY